MGRHRIQVAAALLGLLCLLAACGGGGTGKGTTILGETGKSSTSLGGHPSTGTAQVAAAGSLEGIVQTSLQPAFEHATGDHFVAKFAGSTALAQEIKDGELAPGAFLSVGQAAIASLWPKQSHFALTLATDPLVVAYSPKSRFAPQLNKIRTHRAPLKDLFTVLEKPGFRLARTDPNLDPQGGFFILMFELAQSKLGLPAGTANRILGTSKSNVVGSPSQVVDEDALPTDLSSGTYDAGSDYLTEARQYHLDYITLPPSLDFATPSDLSSYSSLELRLTGGVVFRGGLITLEETAVLPPGAGLSSSDAKASQAFLAFLLGSKGQALLQEAGYVLEKPSLAYAPGYTSPRAALPSSLVASYRRLAGSR